LGIAAIAVLEGNRETAYRHYQHLLQQNPKDEVVNAAIFNLQGNTSGAVNESQLKMLLDQSPDSPQLHFSLGSHYASQSRWPEAQQAFFDAFAADRTNADYAYNLAVSLDQIGQTKAALGYYRTALKLADKNRVSFNTSKVLARIQKLSGLAAR
jgi:tetratricopeptide (TPR) repeat protein